MKYLITVILLVHLVSCKPQLEVGEMKTEFNSEIKPPFSNQGEQEDYWAQELFKKEYKRKLYPKYIGEIKTTDSKIHFGADQFIEFGDSNSKYQLILEKGLFYPGILDATTLTIGNLEELKFLSSNPKVKRFRFWLYYEDLANPQVFLFELTNDKADKTTEWRTFIEDAKLTFIKDGWTII
jgi:hypothetical protein